MDAGVVFVENQVCVVKTKRLLKELLQAGGANAGFAPHVERLPALHSLTRL